MSKRGKIQWERERERESLLKVGKGRVFQILLTPMCKHWDQYNTDCVFWFCTHFWFVEISQTWKLLHTNFLQDYHAVQSSSSFWSDGLWI
jgi:hypothetical protein